MYKNTFKTIVTFICLVLFTACQKDGVFQEALQYADLTVSWSYNTDPGKPYKVEFDGIEITDSLIYNDPQKNSATKRLVLRSNSGRFILKDDVAGTVILDTTIIINNKENLRLLQLSPDEKPIIANGAGENEPDPETRDVTKLQLIYTTPKLPDSIRVDFYSFNLSTYEMDQPYMNRYILKRGAFSDYKPFKFIYGFDTFFFFEVFDAKTGELIQTYDLNTFQGVGYSILNNSGTANPDIKMMTAIVQWGEADDPNGFPDMIYDFPLFFKNW